MSSKRTPPQHWFSNPTENAAIRNSERQERQAEKPQYPKAYICSPYKGDTETNIVNAIRYCKFAVEQGFMPVCPHIYFTRFLDDSIPDERELGLALGIKLLRGCSQIWIFAESLCGGDKISEGMRREILAAKKYGIKIRKFNDNTEEQHND